MGFRVPPTGVNRALRASTSSALRAYKPTQAEIFSMIGTPPGGFVPKGLEAFHINNVGSGVMTVGTGAHKLRSGQSATTTNFLITADRFKGSPRVTQGTLVLVKPNNAGTVELPMHVARKPAKGWVRVAAQVNQDDLNALRGSASGVEFLAKLKFADGTTQWVNQHGTPFQNFTLAKEQLQVPRR